MATDDDDDRDRKAFEAMREFSGREGRYEKCDGLLYAGNHRLGEEHFDYSDGTITAFCGDCGERISMPRIPGGLSALRVQGLLAAVTEDEWADPTAVILEFNNLKAAVAQDVEAVRQCVALLELVESEIEARLGWT